MACNSKGLNQISRVYASSAKRDFASKLSRLLTAFGRKADESQEGAEPQAQEVSRPVWFGSTQETTASLEAASATNRNVMARLKEDAHPSALGQWGVLIALLSSMVPLDRLSRRS